MNSRCDCTLAVQTGKSSCCGASCSARFTWQQDPPTSRGRPHGNPGKLGCQIRQPLRRSIWGSEGKEQHTHTHTGTYTRVFTQIPKIHQRYSPSCITVTPLCVWFQSSLPPPWQPSRCFTRVKLILSGARWVARAQTGRWEPGFQGMQLISIKIPLLGVIRNELGEGERQSIPAAGQPHTETGDNLSR